MKMEAVYVSETFSPTLQTAGFIFTAVRIRKLIPDL
jgi:hypothetical protein